MCKCRYGNSEKYLSLFSPNVGKYGPENHHKVTIKNANFFVLINACLRIPEKLRIWTLFTQ